MQVSETDNGILFILTNKEIKEIKRSPSSFSVSVSKGNEKLKYSFMSQKAWEEEFKRVAKQQQKEMKELEDERKRKEQSTSETAGVHTEGEDKRS